MSKHLILQIYGHMSWKLAKWIFSWSSKFINWPIFSFANIKQSWSHIPFNSILFQVRNTDQFILMVYCGMKREPLLFRVDIGYWSCCWLTDWWCPFKSWMCYSNICIYVYVPNIGRQWCCLYQYLVTWCWIWMTCMTYWSKAVSSAALALLCSFIFCTVSSKNTSNLCNIWLSSCARWQYTWNASLWLKLW